MRWYCAKPHLVHSRRDAVPLTFDSFGWWLLDQTEHWGWAWLKDRLLRWGFLDTKGEFEPIFWRWDYKNARFAAWLRDFERKKWERERDKARARWGEGAG